MMFPISFEYIALALLLLIILILAIWVFQLEIRLKKLCRGKKGTSLEQTLQDVLAEAQQLAKDQQSLVAKHTIMEEKLVGSIQGVATVRFNPFKDSGSNQSFATAFLNKQGDGVIISSLYARERVSIFAKPITNFVSSYELSQEEKDALTQARANFK
jgi:hypothetical protein